jgi:hypothetical protein
MCSISLSRSVLGFLDSDLGVAACLLGVHARVPLEPAIQTTFYGLGVAFQGSLSPANVAVLVRDLDEEPPRWYSKVFHRRYFAHFVGFDVVFLGQLPVVTRWKEVVVLVLLSGQFSVSSIPGLSVDAGAGPF